MIRLVQILRATIRQDCPTRQASVLQGKHVESLQYDFHGERPRSASLYGLDIPVDIPGHVSGCIQTYLHARVSA